LIIALCFWFVLPQKGLVATPWIMAIGSTATIFVYAAGRFDLLTSRAKHEIA